jgi:hypothetical protein
MKFKVGICYAAPSQNHDIVIEVKGSPKGQRLMNAVEKAVEKHMEKLSESNATAKNWTRWNLLDTVE